MDWGVVILSLVAGSISCAAIWIYLNSDRRKSGQRDQPAD